jgi:hypothetical protein
MVSGDPSYEDDPRTKDRVFELLFSETTALEFAISCTSVGESAAAAGDYVGAGVGHLRGDALCHRGRPDHGRQGR